MPSATQIRVEATPQAEAVLAQLLATPYEQLVALPKSQTTHVNGYAKPVALTTYCDLQADGGIQIVIQLAVAGWLGTASFWVEGFTLAPGGTPVRLKPEQLYDFH